MIIDKFGAESFRAYGRDWTVREWTESTRIERFAAFLRQDLNEEILTPLSELNINKNRVLVKFFEDLGTPTQFEVEGSVFLVGKSGNKIYFPKAEILSLFKVLKVGSQEVLSEFFPALNVKAGLVGQVSAKDSETVESPAWKAWALASEKSNNENVKAAEPVKYEQLIKRNYGRSQFLLDPFVRERMVNRWVYTLGISDILHLEEC